jgi:Protein of unknown function (DUF2934)
MSAPAIAKPITEKKPASAQSQAFEPLPHEEIAKLAYTLWQQRGCPDGSAEFDWFLAEEKLLQSVEHP